MLFDYFLYFEKLDFLLFVALKMIHVSNRKKNKVKEYRIIQKLFEFIKIKIFKFANKMSKTLFLMIFFIIIEFIPIKLLWLLYLIYYKSNEFLILELKYKIFK